MGSEIAGRGSLHDGIGLNVGFLSVAVLLVTSITGLDGCAKPYVQAYQEALAENRANISTLRIGMSRAEVDETLGIGTIVDYKKVQLANPWKSEAFRIEDGTPTVILYYVTDGLVWQHPSDRNNLTPVVLESGRVVGWGWSFLERNLDRYQTQTRTMP